MASSSRAPHPDEVRTVLVALQSAQREYHLPLEIPRLPSKAGRPPPPEYAAAAGRTRGGTTPPTRFEVVMLRVQTAVNATRLRLGRASGISPTLLSEESVSFTLVISIINPLGHAVGFGAAGAADLRRLSQGRNEEAALARLCRFEPPYPPEGPAAGAGADASGSGSSANATDATDATDSAAHVRRRSLRVAPTSPCHPVASSLSARPKRIEPDAMALDALACVVAGLADAAWPDARRGARDARGPEPGFDEAGDGRLWLLRGGAAAAAAAAAAAVAAAAAARRREGPQRATPRRDFRRPRPPAARRHRSPAHPARFPEQALLGALKAAAIVGQARDGGPNPCETRLVSLDSIDRNA
jgi:hypothetical protein